MNAIFLWSLFTALFSTMCVLNAFEPIVRMIHPNKTISLFQKYLPNDPVIIDAGAYDGADGALFARRWPNGHVHSFEPIPENFIKLVKTAKKTPNMSIYNFALSTEDGVSEMYVSEFASEPGVPTHSASLRAPKEHFKYAPHVVFPKSIPVETFKIDTWAEKYGVDRVDMMWLDMQGVELEVLKASPKILATTRVIVTEVEFVEAYEGQHRYSDLKSWLEEQGFVMLWCNFDPVNPTKNEQWCGDALFVRKELIHRK